MWSLDDYILSLQSNLDRDVRGVRQSHRQTYRLAMLQVLTAIVEAGGVDRTTAYDILQRLNAQQLPQEKRWFRWW